MATSCVCAGCRAARAGLASTAGREQQLSLSAFTPMHHSRVRLGEERLGGEVIRWIERLGGEERSGGEVIRREREVRRGGEAVLQGQQLPALLSEVRLEII